MCLAGPHSLHPDGSKLFGLEFMDVDDAGVFVVDPTFTPLTQAAVMQQKGSKTRLPDQAMRQSHRAASSFPWPEQLRPLNLGQHAVNSASQAALAEASPSSARSASTPCAHFSHPTQHAQHMRQEQQHAVFFRDEPQGGQRLDGRVYASTAADVAAPVQSALRAAPASTGRYKACKLETMTVL